MAPIALGMPTLDDYAFSLRSGLRQAALANLGDLEAMIQDQGYAWLEGYEEEIMSKPYGYVLGCCFSDLQTLQYAKRC